MMKYVVITGAGGGMGRKTADLFLARGFRVFALDRVRCEELPGLIPVEVDLTSEEGVQTAFEAVSRETQELYAVIHLAGMYLLDSLVELSPEAFERIFQVNLGIACRVNRVFLPLLKPGARIIHVTSGLAVRDPLPFTGLYGITKTALDKYAYSLRMELQLLGISVSVLRAGAVDTGMIDVSMRELDGFCRNTTHYSCNATRFRNIVERVETRKIAPEKVADKIFGIAGKKRPKFAFSINRNPLLILLDKLPKRLRFFAIRKVLEPSKK